MTASGGLDGEVIVVRGTAPVIKKDKTSKKAKQENQSKQDKATVLQPANAADSIYNGKLFGEAIEEMASFPGGSAACMKYISVNLRYPNIQGDCSIQGRVVVGFTVHACPLACKYCPNPQCLEADGVWQDMDTELLMMNVEMDNLYFLATGGGICFGGGEPLLRSSFIKEFCE